MEEKKQLEFLNTFRFISVIWIVFAHFNYQCFSHYFPENIFETFLYNPSSWLYWIFYGITGKYAVAMMCIISGWLVAKKFYNKKVDFGKFLFNRYIRLMLPIFVTCTIYTIILLMQGKTMSLGTYLAGTLWPGNNGINEHLGYILDFLLGNVLIALLTYLFSQKKYLPILYILILIILYFMGKVWIVSTMIGGLTYHLCEFMKEKKRYHLWYLFFIVPVVWILPRGQESDFIYLRDSIACSLIVITFYCLPSLQKIVNWNGLKNIKKISYSLFITHGLVNQLFSGYLVEQFKNANNIQNMYIVEGITFLIVFIIDLIIAGVVYYLIENKLYHTLNHFVEKRVNDYEK